MSASDPILRLQDVTRTYETEGGVQVKALRGVSLSVHAGEFVAIRGPSGCGKSTLLSILGCLDRPDSGSYEVAGYDVIKLDANDLAWLRRNVFGFVFQSYNLLPTATALENTELPAVYAGTTSADRRSRAEQLLASLGLEGRMGHRPSTMSGGEQQRVSIARALMNGGQIILADEPTGALDSATSREIVDLLASLAQQGHTVIMVTHDPEVAARAGRQLEMLDGQIVHDSGTIPDEQTQYDGSTMQMASRVATASLADVAEAVRMAVRSLRATPLRTFLTLLGVVIGVAAVVALLAIGEGAKQRLVQEINALGANRLSVWADARTYPGARLTISDARAVADEVPNVKAVMPSLTGRGTLRIGNRDHTASVNATTPEFPAVRDWPVARGVFFDATDDRKYSPVVVLGDTVRQNLFDPHEDPIGKYVLIGKVPFLVIGTMTGKGAAGFGSRDQDDVVLVPLNTGATRLFGRSTLQAMIVTVDDSSRIDQTEADIRAVLVDRHGMDDIRIRNSAEMQQTMSQAISTATLILGAIGAISLLVGGIGVMNIMLVSVRERTREIGIRVATGARQRDILIQFLTEAVVITCVGGVIGLGVGAGIAWLGAMAIPDVRAAFTIMPMAAAFGCATVIGIVFGFAPARNAARLNPVAALSSD